MGVAVQRAPRRLGRRRWSWVLAALLVALLQLVAAVPTNAAEEPTAPVRIDYYWAEGCPYCALQADFLDELERRFGDRVAVSRYEVSGDLASRERWVEELAERGHQASGVPTTVIGEQVWVGFDAGVGERILAAVETELDHRTPDTPGPVTPEPGPDGSDGGALTVPLVGEVSLAGRSAVAATVLIAFVDGFNPCSLWVLTVLLGMVLNAGATRARIALVGGVFLTVTTVIYGAFIAGAYTVLGLFDHLGAIRTTVALVALVVGAINVKDYVAFKRGVSLTIPDRFKPRIYRGGRMLRDKERSIPAVLATTVVLAAGIALVELPCTAGFPVIWSGIMRTQEVDATGFAALLALYLAIYVIDEVLLFLVALVTLSIGTFQERHGRVLKLAGGCVMLALGVVLLVAPHLLDDLAGALVVMGGALGAAVVIDRLHQRRATPSS